jgi:hypothetical protein
VDLDEFQLGDHMALTPTQQTQILALVQQEGGLPSFTSEVAQLIAQTNNQNALTTLSAGISVTVSDWTVWTKVPDNVVLDLNVTRQIIQAIQAQVLAQNTTNLGGLFVALAITVKRQLGI